MKEKKAAGLRYTKSDKAPKVIAIGRGEIANKIIHIAQKKGVPIYDDPELVDKLVALNLNQEIPPEIYEVVAEVLAFIYHLNSEKELKHFRGGNKDV